VCIPYKSSGSLGRYCAPKKGAVPIIYIRTSADNIWLFPCHLLEIALHFGETIEIKGSFLLEEGQLDQFSRDTNEK